MRQNVQAGDLPAARPPKPPTDAQPDSTNVDASTSGESKPKERRRPGREYAKEVKRELDKRFPNAKRRGRRNSREESPTPAREAARARARRKAKKAANGSADSAGDTPTPVDPPVPAGQPPFVIDEELARQVQACAAFGLTVEELSVVLNISQSTIFEHRQQFAEHLERGKAMSKSRVNKSLYENALAGSLGHAIFWHKVVLGYREKTSTEVSGPAGGAVETIVTQKLMTDEEIQRRLITLVERNKSIMVRPHPPSAEALEVSPDTVPELMAGGDA